MIDFLLPLWAASALAAALGAIGVVVGVEALFSLVVRPAAGVLADRNDTGLVAAGGAALSALAFVLYATAGSIVVVGVGAAFGGAGGALFWVALRADVGRHLEQDPAAYARLLSSEQLGSLLAFVIALTLLDTVGYRALFWLGAAVVGVAAVVLLGTRGSAARQDPGQDGSTVGIRAVGAVLAPLIALTALTAGVEVGLGLLLILHLQSAFDLDPQEIALLFFPGALLLVVLPERAFEVATRLGRARSLMISLAAGAMFAAALALVGTPLVVALMWTLCAACLATAVPVEQSQWRSPRAAASVVEWASTRRGRCSASSWLRPLSPRCTASSAGVRPVNGCRLPRDRRRSDPAHAPCGGLAGRACSGLGGVIAPPLLQRVAVP